MIKYSNDWLGRTTILIIQTKTFWNLRISEFLLLLFCLANSDQRWAIRSCGSKLVARLSGHHFNHLEHLVDHFHIILHFDHLNPIIFIHCKRLPSHTGQGQACTRITRLFVCLFVCSWPCRKWPNTQKNGCWLPPSDHIQSKTLFQTRQDQEKGMNGPASLLHSWRWVLS